MDVMEIIKNVALGVLTIFVAGAAINAGRNIPVVGDAFDFIRDGFGG